MQNKKYYAGIDLGGTNIACGIVDENGKILLKKSCKTNASRPAFEIIDDMASLVKEVSEESGVEINNVAFCGIASPGIADKKTGILGYSNNLPTFFEIPLISEMKKRLPVENIEIENDANAAALGEALAGASSDCENSVLITLGTGVGAGVIIDKKILHGINFAGGEIGHMVIEANGRECTCGRRGCFETYSSATGLINMTKEEMQKNKNSLLWKYAPQIDAVDGRTLFYALKENDESAKKVLDEFAFYLAVGITNIANIFEPEIISLGGGISAEGETILAPVRKIMEKEIYSRTCKVKPQLKKAVLGNDAGIIGAALLWKCHE